ncbi:MAG: transposase [Chitinispirillaceae bacterium]|nr:transposase [Chitinispirillaceae bacterium]
MNFLLLKPIYSSISPFSLVFIRKTSPLEVNSFDDAYNLFLKLIDSLKSKHPNWTKELNEKAENYLTFTKFPKELRSRIKSTNQSENINKELERIRINSGGYFQSERILFVKWFIFIDRLQKGRWAKELFNAFTQNF